MQEASDPEGSDPEEPANSTRKLLRYADGMIWSICFRSGKAREMKKGFKTTGPPTKALYSLSSSTMELVGKRSFRCILIAEIRHRRAWRRWLPRDSFQWDYHYLHRCPQVQRNTIRCIVQSPFHSYQAFQQRWLSATTHYSYFIRCSLQNVNVRYRQTHAWATRGPTALISTALQHQVSPQHKCQIQPFS